MAKDFKTSTLNIHFLHGKKMHFQVASLFFNDDEENNWYTIDNNSICAYEDILVKIVDHIEKKEIYVFLVNTTIVVENDSIEVTTTNEINYFIRRNTKKKQHKNLTDLNEQINYFQSTRVLGIDIEEMINFDEIKHQYYKNKLINILNLKEEFNYE
ncbi:MSC_0621 family F1-like ATPase epsilon subunit [Ureaplasma canigenitalium]|uniref:MSC_0621 family F1-like ATPase epsilon subunit n=1 Tax=Ureaplasma canigenitalium TaxID=42092 RepID=UPI0004E1A956|nr:hypothetical protein [Ureaplasma canigenitalium]